MRVFLSSSAALGALFCLAATAFPCQRTTPVSAVDIVRDAHAIVRAVAGEYAMAPSNPNIVTTGEPDSRVRFKILEIIRGADLKTEVILAGYLGERDDFNDQEPPYTFVRSNGRSGSCFANTYRSGGQFLLLLKKRPAGDYTVNWYPLGPVNEQLRSDSDPWLLWVRQQANRRAFPNMQMTTLGDFFKRQLR